MYAKLESLEYVYQLLQSAFSTIFPNYYVSNLHIENINGESGIYSHTCLETRRSFEIQNILYYPSRMNF